jgi:hypothetical protein
MNYVVYLSYRSNGSPKKIVSLLEDDLVSYEDMISYDRGLEKECVGFSSHNVYLHAGFNKQYNVNFLNYLVSPLVFSINASIKDYGDKLWLAHPSYMTIFSSITRLDFQCPTWT